MNKNSQKEYYNNVLTIDNTKYIIKVVGAKPFEKRSASKGIKHYKSRYFGRVAAFIFLCFYLYN